MYPNRNCYKIVAMIIILSIIFSCASTASVSLLDQKPHSYKKGNIQIFTSPQAVPYIYKEIAIITANDDGWGASDNEMMSCLINSARNIGADGLILLSQIEKPDGSITYGMYTEISETKMFRASAIIKIKSKKVKRSESIDKRLVADEILKFKQLKDSGSITEEEFQKQKRYLLNIPSSDNETSTDTRRWEKWKVKIEKLF